MAVRLDPEQRRIARTIIQRGRRSHANRTELLAALSTGLVEANLRNPAGGDGSSVGWRQETASSYPNVNRRNVAGAADRFFSETHQALKGHRYFPGQLAQAVQRSAYPGRYAQHTGEAAQLLRQFGAGGSQRSPKGRTAVSRGAGTKTIVKTVQTPGIDRSADRQALLVNYLGSRGNPDALLGLAQGLQGAQDVPGSSKTTKQVVRVKGKGPAGKAGFGGYHFVVGKKHQFSEERTDRGQDFSTNPGGTVNAIGRARVVATSGVFPGRGPVLQLLDGPYKGKYVFYGHMRASLVRRGQVVKAGQPVAVAGGVGGGGPGHAEVGFALDASGRIDPNVGSDHFSARTGGSVPWFVAQGGSGQGSEASD